MFENAINKTYKNKSRHIFINNTGQQNLTFFFGTRGKLSNPNRTFKAEFKCVSSFSPSPTVCS